MGSEFAELHMGRSWRGHDLEDDCPCPKERCGLVAQAKVNPDCPQHGFKAAKTMRQFHYANRCPARPAPIRWANKVTDRIHAGFGIGAMADGIATWDWAGSLRFWASYWLGLGHWFHDKRDRCRRCGAMPSDVDFTMRRVGPRRAECIDAEMCREAVEETPNAR